MELQTILDDCYDMPSLERDGKPISHVPWITNIEGCAECSASDRIAMKRVLWNMSDELVIYVHMKICVNCWPNIGWEAWTLPSTDIGEYLTYLCNSVG
jgi:hypothetical protein